MIMETEVFNFTKTPPNRLVSNTTRKEHMVTLSAKIPRVFQEVLKTEATERGFSSPSDYIRNILDRRDDAQTDVSALHDRIYCLEAENAELYRKESYPESLYSSPGKAEETEALKTELHSLKQQLYKSQQLLAKANQQRDTLVKIQGEQIPHWLSKEGYQQLLVQLKQLRRRYPHVDEQTLLLDACKLTLKNESSLVFVRKLKDFSPKYRTNKTK